MAKAEPVLERGVCRWVCWQRLSLGVPQDRCLPRVVWGGLKPGVCSQAAARQESTAADGRLHVLLSGLPCREMCRQPRTFPSLLDQLPAISGKAPGAGGSCEVCPWGWGCLRLAFCLGHLLVHV